MSSGQKQNEHINTSPATPCPFWIVILTSRSVLDKLSSTEHLGKRQIMSNVSSRAVRQIVLRNNTTILQTARRHMASSASSLSESSVEPSQRIWLAPKSPLVLRKHLKVALPDDCQVLHLSDGRLMSFAEYGSKAPDAHSIIFCHGIPDCRLDACLLISDQEIAKKLNVRWIGIDRPGIGLSSTHESRNTLSWVEDLRELINALNLKSYYIFGVSGGTGYALAAAKLLPREQVRGVGIMIGVAPWESSTNGMSILNRIGYFVWKHVPGVFGWIFDRELVPIMQAENQTEAEELMSRSMKYGSQIADTEDIDNPEMVSAITKIYREVCRQGAGGWVEDSKVQTGDWGFKIEDVQYPGVHLWYGEKDVNTPPSMGKHLAARLTGSLYKEFAGKTHFTMWHHMEEILTELIGHGR